MQPRLRLIYALALTAACSPKVDLTESASDTHGSSGTHGSAGSTDSGDSSSAGHSQTSATEASDTTSSPPTGGGQTVTTANPSEPGTLSATETDGSASDTVPGTVSTVTTDTSSTSHGSFSTGDFCNDPPNQPQDAACVDPSGCGCASDRCFIIPALGGFCGECLGDSDCSDGGCTVPNPIAGTGATCNAGLLGDGCQTDAACTSPAAPRCAEMFSVPSILTVSTCGQCETDADCPPQAPHCTPDYDLKAFGGQRVCRAAASVANNSGCDAQGTGDVACASGHCGQADVMGLLKLGVCGQCGTDSDCGPGQQCSEPEADLGQGALLGSVCQ